MSLQDRLRAGSASFAHLAGLGRVSAARRAEEDERREGDDDDKRDAKRAEDDERKDDEDGDKKDAKSKRAEDDDDKSDDDERAEDDDGDDDSDKEDMRGKGASGKAYRRGISRCAAIFMSRHAAANPAMAAELAFNTTLSRKEAVAVLAAAPVSTGRAARVDRNPQLGPGGEGQPSSSQATAASWDRAFTKTLNRMGRRSA